MVNKISDVCFFAIFSQPIKIAGYCSCKMCVELMSFYFMNTIAVFSVTFSHIFDEKINFCCNFRSVTYIFELNVSLVSSLISCNAETSVYGIVCRFAHIMRLRDISLRQTVLHSRTQFYLFPEY